MKTSILRYIMLLDAVVLFLLGLCLMAAPHQIQGVFQFKELPSAVNYMLGLWGCGFASLGVGYFFAAADPCRHLLWVQVGIARGFLECILGFAYLARGIVSFQQAGFGIVLAALITLAYLACYPWAGKPRQPIPAR